VVGVLIAMKLRALRNSLRGATGVFFVIGAVVGIVAAAAAVLLMATHSGGLTVGTDIASAFFAVWTLGWLFGPVLSGGGDETLRPENFALLPLRPKQLAVGLLGASLAGVAPVVALIVFLGLVTVAIPAGLGATAVALLAAVAQLALVVLASRVVIAGVGALLGTRRGKDLGILLGALVGLGYLPARWAFEQLGPIVEGQTSPLVTAVLRGMPSGWGPDAVVAAADGRWLAAAGGLAALVVLDVLLVLAWSPLLQRRLTVAESSAGPRRKERTARTDRRSLLPDTPLGAVIGKELRMWSRDAQRRTLMASSILVGLILPAFTATQGAGLSGLSISALWIVFFVSLQVGNLYGMDGSAVWQTVTTPGAARADVRGRQWAWALVVGPVVLVAMLALPAAVGAPGVYPWLFALVPVLFGAGAGIVVLSSVIAAYPMPTGKGRNPFTASAGGRGFATIGTRLVLMVVEAVFAVPVIVLLVVGATVAPAATWAAIPVSIAVGIGAAWWLGRRAYRRVEIGGPELLAAVKG
jgi:ABC-2 type transport system permease protein